MSGENAELIRRVYELGLDLHVLHRAFDEYLTEDVELRLPAVYPDATAYRGREGLERWLEMVDDTWREWAFEPERFYEAGDRVLVLVRLVAAGGQSGVRLDRKVAHVWSIRDGRVTAIDVYLERDEAFAAVGLREVR